MHTLNLVLSALLHLLLLSHPAECTHPTLRKQSLLEVLRASGLDGYAGFLEKFPTPEMNDPDIILFAPSNQAVKDYLAANPDTERDTIHRRDAAKNVQANKNNIGYGATTMASLPAKGRVVATGGGGSSGNKVAQPAAAGGGGGGSGGSAGANGRRVRNLDLYERALPPQSYYATITAGGGIRTKVLKDSISFDNGVIYEVDR